jgi:hypothetical protein
LSPRAPFVSPARTLACDGIAELEAGFEGFEEGLLDFEGCFVCEDRAGLLDFAEWVDFATFVDLAGLLDFAVFVALPARVEAAFVFVGAAFVRDDFTAGSSAGGACSAGIGSVTSRGDTIGCAYAIVVAAVTPAANAIAPRRLDMKRTISGVRLARWIWSSVRR